ncbi:pentapeptide repeat-containing protein [Acaryochloris sp. IP29b_bin.148]|uniref:pentapeptide repeat-containing protein n=1 Tax=Acaryochloris sp. IP29b_bin.148 TaxID=2969218 RepID=UPI0026102D6F|nr:pentapeptide repeat-containing protein [Acaryochloris sp. IP29b_bin.148]
MTAEELLERYAAGERDFSGIDLRGADLRGVDLHGADLSGADLSGADLSGYRNSEGIWIFSNLSKVNLSGANLEHAFVNAANLSDADLTNVRFNCTEMLHVHLERADMRGSCGSWTSEGAYYHNTILDDGSVIVEPCRD